MPLAAGNPDVGSRHLAERLFLRPVFQMQKPPPLEHASAE